MKFLKTIQTGRRSGGLRRDKDRKRLKYAERKRGGGAIRRPPRERVRGEGHRGAKEDPYT